MGGEVDVGRASRWACVTSEEGHTNPQRRATAAHFAPLESRKPISSQEGDFSLSLSLSPLAESPSFLLCAAKSNTISIFFDKGNAVLFL